MKKLIKIILIHFISVICVISGLIPTLCRDISFAQTWSAVGTGTNSNVFALTVHNTELYVGGDFTTAGGSAANRIAKWDGTTWNSLGTGMNGRVSALAVYNDTLYAGGSFTTAGGSAANYIARWDGSSWSAVGTGMNANVLALAVYSGELYAGGDFTTAGGSAANYIAKWNGSSWSAVGTGMNANVQALTVIGFLYAGGAFITAGGSPANHIARWNGSSWSALGTGTNLNVYTIALYGGNLYAGGAFTFAGGGPTTYIARWNGVSWTAVGTGVDFFVNDLIVHNAELYAGGWFSNAGGSPANYIAKWDGSSWSALGTGMDLFVEALAVYSGELYACGWFTTAGGVAATYIAKWGGAVPIELLSFTATSVPTPNPSQEGNKYVLTEWTTTSEINTDFYTIERSQDGINWGFVGTIKAAGNSTVPLNYSLLDKNPYPGTSYYRLIQYDINGDYEIYGPVAVKLEGVEIISIFPNPARDKIAYQVVSWEDTEASIRVLDLLGREVIVKKEAVQKGLNTFNIDVSGLRSSIYLIQIATETGNYYSRKEYIVN